MYNVTYVYTYVFSLLRLILCQSLCWPPRRTKGAFQKNDLALLNGAVSLLPPWNLPCWPMIDLWYPIIISTYWARHQLTSAQLFSARQQDPVYTYNYTVYIHIYIYTWLNTVPTCWFMLIHCTLMLMLYLNGACGGCSDRLWSQRREVPWKLAVRRARAERKSPTERTVDEHLSCVYLMYVDVRWCVLMYLDVCWCVMMCVDVCLCTLMYVNVCWCMLMCVDVWWCMLMCVDVCWCMLMFVDVRWCVLMHVDVCWCIMNIWTWIANGLQMDCKWQHVMFPYTWVFFRATLSQAALRVAKGRRDDVTNDTNGGNIVTSRHDHVTSPTASRVDRGVCLHVGGVLGLRRPKGLPRSLRPWQHTCRISPFYLC